MCVSEQKIIFNFTLADQGSGMERALGQTRAIVDDNRPRDEHQSRPNNDARIGAMNGEKSPPPPHARKDHPKQKQPRRQPDQMTKAQKKSRKYIILIFSLSSLSEKKIKEEIQIACYH